MRNNEYLMSIERQIEDYYNAKREREARKEQIIRDYGYGSDELKRWWEEENNAKFPVADGVWKAARAAFECDGEVEVVDCCWEREIHDFIDTFRKAGIHSFVITCTSTALMYNIHGFVAEGCKMEGVCTIEKEAFGGTKQVQGIRFTL